MENKFITGKDFYELILNRSAHTDLFTYLTEVEMNSWATRALAARIVHDFLRKVLGEKECDFWDAAKELADLYDCRTCVSHVVECYVKGIMDGRRSERNHEEVIIFDLKAFVTYDEAQTIVERIFNADRRTERLTAYSALGMETKSREISCEELEAMLAVDKSVNIIDVRPKNEYLKGTYAKARNIELKAIMNNPYILNDKPDAVNQTYCFICNEGYQSRMAAEVVYTAGFRQVYYLGMK